MEDKEVGRMVTKFNLFDWRLRLEAETREIWSWARIAKAAGLHTNTVTDVGNNNIKRTDLVTLEKLANFFRSKGLDVKSGDLLVDVPLTDAA